MGLIMAVIGVYIGVALLPEGKRKKQLKLLADDMLLEFDSRCLGFEYSTSEIYSEIVASCLKQGRAISTEDAQIAAISKQNKLVLVTRNIRDFEMIEGIELYNPFD